MEPERGVFHHDERPLAGDEGRERSRGVVLKGMANVRFLAMGFGAGLVLSAARSGLAVTAGGGLVALAVTLPLLFGAILLAVKTLPAPLVGGRGAILAVVFMALASLGAGIGTALVNAAMGVGELGVGRDIFLFFVATGILLNAIMRGTNRTTSARLRS